MDSKENRNPAFPPYARHCEGFNPSQWSQLIDGTDGKPFWNLSVDLRLKWAQIYCEENNIQFRAIVDGPKVMQIGPYYFLYMEASVFFGDTLIAHDTSGFPLQEGNGGFRHDHAIQTAGTMALGRALRSAGFATVGGTTSELGDPVPCDGGVPAGRFTPVQNPAYTTSNPAPSACQPVQQKPNPLAPPYTEQPQSMTLEQAKAAVIPNGTFAGKTMGELFSQNPQQVEWWAKSGYVPALKQAAQVILDNNP